MNPKPDCILIRVFHLHLKFAYPNGFWKGLCETCLDSAQKIYLEVNKNKPSCRKGKCALCESKTGVFPAELEFPDFSKGIVKKDVNLCYRCLKGVDEAYIRHKKEMIEQEHAHH
ncbi:F420H2 dehydrogenase subunit FpoO [Methanosarcina siciliae C2J]|uniref:F420H2 dehydrogenase subunit FpoO n=1 Tax=Methanosarcina siciliae C2J TaxID=1434118 RepID=A0A0E3LCS4_9EURY|nr:F420H2 dehydrogenase subunit FpoO [Methanosarcina siciliae]AKB36026.1 F420H2 dehydrogenase subunit FpoO [Methanosarcina siciliae C2J]